MHLGTCAAVLVCACVHGCVRALRVGVCMVRVIARAHVACSTNVCVVCCDALLAGGVARVRGARGRVWCV